MKTNPLVEPHHGQFQAEIIKVLERLTANGRRAHQVFEDFLDLTEATLRMMPAHAQSVAVHKRMAEDPPDIAALWAEKRKLYSKEQFADFAAAFHLLLGSTGSNGEIDWQDVVGDVYMTFGHPSAYAGQFFTPFPVAKMMAMMIHGDSMEQEIKERIKAAAKDNPLLQAIALVSSAPGADESPFFQRLLPIVRESVQPITVQDPCCGSGVMFLALASCLPKWVLKYQFVTFYGIDLDQTCVKMARINLMLYGLNGFSLRCANALGYDEISRLPQPHASHYTTAKKAEEDGDLVTVESIKQLAREGKGGQLEFF